MMLWILNPHPYISETFVYLNLIIHSPVPIL